MGAADAQDDPARGEVFAHDGDDVHEAAGSMGDAQQRRVVDRGDHRRRALVDHLTRPRIGGWVRDGAHRGATGVDVVDHRVGAPHERAQDAADLGALERSLDESHEGPKVTTARTSPKSTVTAGTKSSNLLVWRPTAASA